MKNKIVTTLLLAFIITSCNQSRNQCCDPSTSSATMASLASDKSFRDAHEAPLKLDYEARGKMFSYPTPDGKNATAYLIPSGTKSNNYLFVLHEWWGLNNWIKQMADMFSDSLNSVNVIALDLYDGKVTAKSDEAGELMQSNDAARSNSIINGALNYIGKNARVATIGWCFGGGWSMQAALLSGSSEVGCVMYYGMPETDVTRLKAINSDILFIWPNKDQWINADVKNSFVKNMNLAGKKLIVKEYAADHAFANPSNPHHDTVATADAQKITIAYLRKAFGK